MAGNIIFILCCLARNLLTGLRVQPYLIAAVTVLPAFLTLALLQLILKSFYFDGTRLDAVDHFNSLTEEYLNDVSGAFLSVAGVVYGIVSAHLLSMAYDRYHNIEEALREELGHLHQVLADRSGNCR